MVEQSPDAARPTPEPWTEDRPRPNWAPYDLPNSAILLIEGEQMLADLGVRDIVAGLASASVTDFQNGLASLKRVFIAQYDEGFKDGQHNVLEHAPTIFSLQSIAVFVIGAALGAVVAAAVVGLLAL